MQVTPSIESAQQISPFIDKSHIIIPVAKRNINNKVCRAAHTLTNSPTKTTNYFSREQFLRSQTVKRSLFDNTSPTDSPWSSWSDNEDEFSKSEEDRPAIESYTATLTKAIRKETTKQIKETIAHIKEIGGDVTRVLKKICTDDPCFASYKKFLPIASILDIATVHELEEANGRFAENPIWFFQSALDQKDIQALHIGSALALFKGQSVTPILDQIEAHCPFTKNVLSKFNRLLELPYETHYLISAELFKICFVAEKYLQMATEGDLYLPRELTHLQRSLQLNLKNREFSILCKKHSCIESIRGSEKKISPIILVPDQEMVSTDYVRISNQPGHTITKLECDLLVYFAKKRSARDIGFGELRSVYIDQKNDKQSILQRREECLLSLAPDEKGIKITETELIELLKDIAEDIFTMHNGEMCHHDLKLENILFKKLPDGALHACITDFGLACAAYTIPQHGTKSYGTEEYTAPETLAYPDIQGNSKAKDMYAIGYMMHELLLGQPKWGAQVRRYFFEKQFKLLQLILEKQRSITEELAPLAAQNPLYALMIRLLDPNPETRMTAMEFALTLKYM